MHDVIFYFVSPSDLKKAQQSFDIHCRNAKYNWMPHKRKYIMMNDFSLTNSHPACVLQNLSAQVKPR